MFVDVFVDQEGQPVKHRIPVYEGDQADKLAEKFCEKHGYDMDTQDALQQSLQMKITETIKQMKLEEN